MTQGKSRRIVSVSALLLMGLAVLSSAVYAQNTKVEGIIKARSGDTLELQTSNSPKVVVLLTESTDVGQLQGALKARNKKMSMAALIPGLPIRVEGSYDAQNQLVANTIRFKGNDFEQAQAISAGVHETAQQAAANQKELEEQNAALKEQQAQLTEQQKKLAEHKALIAANTARFGQLDDYYIYDEVTVYFGNGKVKLDPQYNAPLLALAQKAETVNGYVIQVKGYASSSGSAALNQKLSEDRANAVATYLQQEGHVPLSRMLAPGAMGESRQVDSGNANDSEAENRRVVVRILQNKGIAGIQ
ncbi:outer membrane protein OmpA-like peptidoglycan-associated protein [Edaphobacter aggregans]|jgi:outer membrane protein OmpA-like peptidoglycan-associated protein|uniref:Outer membrane protein OmpA-like peptidoglycan-associated protein n=1 Tax=Edaphobacter aggregans TaxID=570835 RepID=A0A428MQT1_9BACT|nr:OmpA family protein [Edaphobacter aggregans]RSL19210.1 outer membrane protein OmpA-like peptidoglycan-associated protein [Edaphobacter aggregans]